MYQSEAQPMTHDQKESWSERSATARRQHISGYIAFTPGMQGALSLVSDLYDSWRESPEGEISFLKGETRAGKTTALDEFIINKHLEISEKYKGREGYQVSPLGEDSAFWAVEIKTPTGWLRPIVKVQVSKKPRYKSLFADVLATMGIKAKLDALNATQMLNLLTTQLHEQQTRVIAFDECHHISEFKDPDGTYDAGDLFKIVAKCGRSGVICCGLPHMMDMVDANKQVQECERGRYTVPPFSLDVNPTSDLKRFMAALNEQLPFDEPSCLDQDDIVIRIALLREGFAGRIAKFVHQVAAYAISNGAPCVDSGTLKSFLRVKKEVADEANIFLIERENLGSYPDIVKKAQRDRMLEAEKRRARPSTQRRVAANFGARG